MKSVFEIEITARTDSANMNDGFTTENFMRTPPGSTRIKLLAPVVVAGFPGKQVGDIFEVPNNIASLLINQKAAEESAEIVQEVQAATPEVIETREPVVETRDPEIDIQALAKKQVFEAQALEIDNAAAKGKRGKLPAKSS